jgi:hypothetical protein
MQGAQSVRTQKVISMSLRKGFVGRIALTTAWSVLSLGHFEQTVLHPRQVILYIFTFPPQKIANYLWTDNILIACISGNFTYISSMVEYLILPIKVSASHAALLALNS